MIEGLAKIVIFTSLHSTLKIAFREKPVKVLRADCTKLKKFL